MTESKQGPSASCRLYRVYFSKNELSVCKWLKSKFCRHLLRRSGVEVRVVLLSAAGPPSVSFNGGSTATGFASSARRRPLAAQLFRPQKSPSAAILMASLKVPWRLPHKSHFRKGTLSFWETKNKYFPGPPPPSTAMGLSSRHRPVPCRRRSSP